MRITPRRLYIVGAYAAITPSRSCLTVWGAGRWETVEVAKRPPTLIALGLFATLSVMHGACMVEVPGIKACGDTKLDRAAGEECDPTMDPDELADLAQQACDDNDLPRGAAICDPVTCQFIATAVECAVCGDGITMGAEDCDNSQPIKKCPDGVTAAECNTDSCTADFSNCPSCGNGWLDLDIEEECDPNISISPGEEGGDDGPGLVQVVSCRDLSVLAFLPEGKTQPNEAPGPITYTGGDVGLDSCGSACQFSRQSCNFCGDGELDGLHTDRTEDNQTFSRPAERCELGVHSDYMTERCREWCGTADAELEVDCVYECNDDCSDGWLMYNGDMEGADPIDDLGCCLAKGERCDPSGIAQEFPCCKGLANPEDGNGCDGQKFDANDNLIEVCG